MELELGQIFGYASGKITRTMEITNVDRHGIITLTEIKSGGTFWIYLLDEDFHKWIRQNRLWLLPNRTAKRDFKNPLKKP